MTAAAPSQPGMQYKELQKILKSAKTDKELFDKVVNAPFQYRVEAALLFLGIMVLLLVNEKDGTIDRVALSSTELAKNTTDVSIIPFEKIRVPVDDPENIIAQAIRSQQPHDTTDWRFLFTPALTAEQARINQASGGIAYSAVYPLKARAGALIFSYFQYKQEIGAAQRDFMERYQRIVDARL